MRTVFALALLLVSFTSILAHTQPSTHNHNHTHIHTTKEFISWEHIQYTFAAVILGSLPIAAPTLVPLLSPVGRCLYLLMTPFLFLYFVVKVMFFFQNGPKPGLIYLSSNRDTRNRWVGQQSAVSYEAEADPEESAASAAIAAMIAEDVKDAGLDSTPKPKTRKRGKRAGRSGYDRLTHAASMVPLPDTSSSDSGYQSSSSSNASDAEEDFTIDAPSVPYADASTPAGLNAATIEAIQRLRMQHVSEVEIAMFFGIAEDDLPVPTLETAPFYNEPSTEYASDAEDDSTADDSSHSSNASEAKSAPKSRNTVGGERAAIDELIAAADEGVEDDSSADEATVKTDVEERVINDYTGRPVKFTQTTKTYTGKTQKAIEYRFKQDHDADEPAIKVDELPFPGTGEEDFLEDRFQALEEMWLKGEDRREISEGWSTDMSPYYRYRPSQEKSYPTLRYRPVHTKAIYARFLNGAVREYRDYERYREGVANIVFNLLSSGPSDPTIDTIEESLLGYEVVELIHLGVSAEYVEGLTRADVRGLQGFGICKLFNLNLFTLDVIKTKGDCFVVAMFIYVMTHVKSLINKKPLIHNVKELSKLRDLYKIYKASRPEHSHSAHIQGCTKDFVALAKAFKILYPSEPTPTLRMYHETVPLHMQWLQALTPKHLESNVLRVYVSASNHMAPIWDLRMVGKRFRLEVLKNANQMMRGHINLFRCKKNPKPFKHVNTMDFECISRVLDDLTVIQEPVLLGANVLGQRECFYASSPQEVIDQFVYWVMQVAAIGKTKSIKIWAHNMAKYDYVVSARFWIKHLDCSKIHPLDENAIKGTRNKQIICLKGGVKLTLVDSFKHLGSSLETLGQTMLGRGKLTESFNPMLATTPEEFNTDVAKAYCMGDVDLLHDVLIAYEKGSITAHENNPLRYPTISSFGKADLLASLSKRTKIALLTPKLWNWHKKGAYGGATEAYVPIGEYQGIFDCFDFNSAYPSIMRDEEIPMYIYRKVKADDYDRECHQYPEVNREGKVESAQLQWFKEHPGFYSVWTRCPKDEMRAVLCHADKGLGLVFDLPYKGAVYEAVPSCLLVECLTRGYEVNLHHGYEWKCSKWMSEWTDKKYQGRLDSKNDVEKQSFKSVLNNTQGGFATTWENNTRVTAYGRDFVSSMTGNAEAGMSRELYKTDDIWIGTETMDIVMDSTNIAIPSWIWAQARLKLFRAREVFESTGVPCFYSDTDSLIVRRPYLEYEYEPKVKAIIDPKKLGLLKQESHYLTAGVYDPEEYGTEFLCGGAKAYGIKWKNNPVPKVRWKGNSERLFMYDHTLKRPADKTIRTQGFYELMRRSLTETVEIRQDILVKAVKDIFTEKAMRVVSTIRHLRGSYKKAYSDPVTGVLQQYSVWTPNSSAAEDSKLATALELRPGLWRTVSSGFSMG